MQLMTWPLGRLGSRFGLLMEPGRRRVLHSALGRFFDQPLDLAVGFVEPDGTERVLPFTADGQTFYATEQFERVNSITYRGYSDTAGLRFELNFHCPFYPQNEQVCLMPAIYVELRVAPARRVRLRRFADIPGTVRLFVRLRRPNTRIEASERRIDLAYETPLDPQYEASCGERANVVESDIAPPIAHIVERLHSINEGATPSTDERGGVGLTLDLPVTAEGSGVKWRLVWAAHCADPVLEVQGQPARFRYVKHWDSLDAVMDWAIEHRDENLALSRRFEKLLEQAPLARSKWHLMVFAFQSYLSNTYWCDLEGGDEMFSVLEGSSMYHNTLDVAYNLSLFYFAVWPRLLLLCLERFAEYNTDHDASGGLIFHHDMGYGARIGDAQAYDPPMPVEENSNFLLLLQAYCHWTGDTEPIARLADVVRGAARYLLWTDHTNDGFPDEGTANTLDDGSPAVQLARNQTYLAIKRTTALDAAADLLLRAGDEATAETCRAAALDAVPSIERRAWLDDHYVVCIDHDTQAMVDADTGEALPLGPLEGWDDYSIYTANGLLLPVMIGQPIAFDRDRLEIDMTNAWRETRSNYGCGHTSSDATNIWISQNLWRDHAARYLRIGLKENDGRYWDLQVMSNTADNSFGYTDTYIGNELAFNPRGAVVFGYLLAGPRLVVDRLDIEYFAVDPDRHRPVRWPLLPLADWDAGRVPICVVHGDGTVSIEGEIEPIKVVEHVAPDDVETIG